MVEQIRSLLHETPFRPFRLKLANGRTYEVETGDHAWVMPRKTGGTLMVATNDGVAHFVPPLMIVEIETAQATE